MNHAHSAAGDFPQEFIIAKVPELLLARGKSWAALEGRWNRAVAKPINGKGHHASRAETLGRIPRDFLAALFTGSSGLHQAALFGRARVIIITHTAARPQPETGDSSVCPDLNSDQRSTYARSVYNSLLIANWGLLIDRKQRRELAISN
jgi:hypothetical protein